MGKQKKRKWTAAEKLAILKEAEKTSVAEVLRRHNLFSQTFYGWKDKYEADGMAGLEQIYKREGSELKRLKKENVALKTLLAEKELALKMKDDLLKKSR